jgi:hypothetical protein
VNALHGGHLWNQQSETVVCEEIIRILGVRETRTRMIYFIHKKIIIRLTKKLRSIKELNPYFSKHQLSISLLLATQAG